MRLRRLSESGLQQMHLWLDQVASVGHGSVPDELLQSDSWTEAVDPRIEIEHRSFASRLEWSLFAMDVLAPLAPAQLQGDRGLWAWLSLVFFDGVCPRSADGKRRIGARARYIPAGSDYRTYYRHLLQGPWRVVRAHRDDPERALAVLSGRLDRPGEIAEQLTSRLDLVSSPTVMRAATLLYIDPATRAPKRGAGGSGPGSARRLAEVLLQFDLTFDIYGMPTERLLALLPREFDRYKQA